MRTVFADTVYFVALINPQDQWHEATLKMEPLLSAATIITTESVLMELLNYLSGFRPSVRKNVASFVRFILDDPEFEIIPHTREAFLSGLELYESRLDKGYSLTDCISMSAMRERDISDALTHDNHFRQEGFNVLL